MSLALVSLVCSVVAFTISAVNLYRANGRLRKIQALQAQIRTVRADTLTEAADAAELIGDPTHIGPTYVATEWLRARAQHI